MKNYDTTVQLPGSRGYAIVDATIGTQSIGSITGHPLPMTDPGAITLTVVDPDTGALARFKTDNMEIMMVLRDALSTALSVAKTRDHSADQARDEAQA